MFAHIPASYVLKVEETEPGKQWERIENGFDLQQEIQSSGKEMRKQVFVYKVPMQEFEDQDIALNFLLETLNGPSPEMLIMYCNEHEDEKTRTEAEEACAKKALPFTPQEIIERSKSTSDVQTFQWAKQV